MEAGSKMESQGPFQKSRGKSNAKVEGYRTGRNCAVDHVESLCDSNVTTIVHCGFPIYFFITVGTQNGPPALCFVGV